MQSSILWQGREYDSKEHCLVHTTEKGVKVDSVIVGQYQDFMYRVEYSLVLNERWETLSFTVSSIHNSTIQRMEYTRDEENRWFDRGERVERLDGCTDIDIPLTPFTNSLPINRLRQSPGQEDVIRVVYIDVLAEKISPLNQKYKRLSADRIRYQNIPNDFEAELVIDENGFVTDYPGLFIQRGLYQFHQ